MFKNIKNRLQIYFQLIGLIPMAIFGFYNYYTTKETITKQSFDRLTSVRELRKRQVEGYIQKVRQEAVYFSSNSFFLDALEDMSNAYNNFEVDSSEMSTVKPEIINYYENIFYNKLAESDKKNTPIYDYIPLKNAKTLLYQYHYIANRGERVTKDKPYFNVHEKYDLLLKDALEKFKYYDIFLIDNDGNIVYTVAKELDFAANVNDPMIKETNIYKIYNEFKKVQSTNTVKIYDYQFYLPSAYEPSIFCATNMFRNDKKIGTLVLQLSIDEIDNIMTGNQNWKSDGLGASGETYIVGPDYKMRTNSRFILEDPKGFFEAMKTYNVPDTTLEFMKAYKTSILYADVKTDASKNAHNKLVETKIINDYRNIPVLSSYSLISDPDLKWALLSEIDEAEVFEPINQVRSRVIIASILVFLLIAIVSNFVSGGISRPLFTLSAAADEVSKGNLDVHADVNTGDEIENLSNVFNKMVKDVKGEKMALQSVLGELEKGKSELEEQTLALSKSNQEAEIQKIQVEAKNRELEGVISTVNAQKTEMERQAIKINQSYEETQSLVKQLDEEKRFIENQNREFEANSKVLMNLAKSKNIQQGNFETSIKEIAQKTSLSLDITQVGVWELSQDNETLTSLAMYNKDEMKYLPSISISQKDYPIYFQAITSGEPINAPNAESDLNTIEFNENYLKPNNIKSMLDIPYYVDGLVRGVICCEHKNVVKKFDVIDFNFTKSIADILTIAYKSLQRKEAEVQIQEQSHIIEEKNKDIIASINYAKRIQSALLPADEYVKSLIPNHFLYYKPKDIISGDFYWIDYVSDKIIIVIADCTGHGVPGAFMTMIGDNQLDQIVREKKITSPELILSVLHFGVAQTLKQNENDIRDGMDVGIVVIDAKAKKMAYAGAMNPLYYVQNGEFFEIKADKRPIGGRTDENDKVSFTKHEIDISTPTTFYLCTDGFQDQFGGPDKRKFMVKRLKEKLHAISAQPINTQKQEIFDTMNNWMGNDNPQVDDMIVFGATV
ncbi:MAG: HAMP domain-containing protein [Bacteroidetes bacterium]|nr:MAG: HAMP domain-containing protein [Bacteroidota bacterium]